MWFEDFRVGQRSATGPHAVDAGAPELAGAALALATLPGGRAADLTWSFGAQVTGGDAVTVEAIVTRCRREPTGQSGRVRRHLRVLGAGGAVLQEGTSTVLVEARGPAPDPDPALATDFCSAGWAALLVPSLEENAAFTGATRTFDGALGLRAGDAEIQLRVYRGRVLEAARSTPLGPTFTLGAGELEWTELVLAERNEFMARATRGAFTVRGNAHEYLRLTKALVAIVDEARALAARGGAG